MPGAHEKRTGINLDSSYQEPALVPLGEKPKVWKDNPIKGTRQISPVPSVYGVPAFVVLWLRLQGAITKDARLFNKNTTYC